MSDSKEEEEEPKPLESEGTPSSPPGDASATDDPAGSEERPDDDTGARADRKTAGKRRRFEIEDEIGEADEKKVADKSDAKDADESEDADTEDGADDIAGVDEDEDAGEDDAGERFDPRAAATFMHSPEADEPLDEPQLRLPNFKDISALEIAGLAGVAALILAALLAFTFMWRGQVASGGKTDGAVSRLKKSVDGELMSLVALETYWKEPGPNERVQANRNLVPEVLVRLGTTTLSETAYLKAVFRDDEGTIRGDVTSRRVENGNFADTSTPEIRIFSTDGFHGELDLVRYSSGESDPWTVEIFEGPSYAGSDWNRLAFVTIEAKLRGSADAEN